MHIQNLVKFYPFVLQIFEWKQNSDPNQKIKGHNSVTNLRKMTGNNPTLDLCQYK